MTYIIRHSDDHKLIELDSEIIDTETVSGIGLIGYLTPNYGETQSNNFVHLVENFASNKFPESPLIGQIFYKKSGQDGGSLYICRSLSENEDERWKKLPLIYIGTEEPNKNTAKTGDMWYDTENHQFKMYDGEDIQDWISIGPENFNDSLSKITKNDSDNDMVIIGEYDFNSLDIKNKTVSYLITIDVIGKEILKDEVSDSNSYLTSSQTAGWKIKLLVNCYQTSPNQLTCEIVDEPDYELIGRTSETDNWYVKAKLDGYILKIEAKGSVSNEDTKVRWISRINMLKVG